MPAATGTRRDSTIVSMRPMIPNTTGRRMSTGVSVSLPSPPDDREIFKILHDCMKDVGKFRQYIYYLGTSCDTTKLRNKIQKLKDRINRGFHHQRDLICRGASAVGLAKSELAIRRLEKCVCFTLASMNYYEDLLHKFSMLLVYFPLAPGDSANVVTLGFEDSTINADEMSVENYENEDNETNLYIELLNQIQSIQTLREEIEGIDVYQLRNHSTSYSKEFVDNMHKYNNESLTGNSLRKHHGRHGLLLRHYRSDESRSSSVCWCCCRHSKISRFHHQCNRRKCFCLLTVSILLVLFVGIIVSVVTTARRALATGQ